MEPPKDSSLNSPPEDSQVFLQLPKPSFLQGTCNFYIELYISKLYRAVYFEPTKIMVMVVHGSFRALCQAPQPTLPSLAGHPRPGGRPGPQAWLTESQNSRVCVYVYMYMYIYIKICISVHMHIYIHVCIHISIYICIAKIKKNRFRSRDRLRHRYSI